jgi:hypothetical protein
LQTSCEVNESPFSDLERMCRVLKVFFTLSRGRILAHAQTIIIMDKLKRALTGREEPDDEERGFVAQVGPPFLYPVSIRVADPHSFHPDPDPAF